MTPTSGNDSTFVRCADELRAFHSAYLRSACWKVAAIMIPSVFGHVAFDAPWLVMAGIVITAAFVIIPLQTTYQRKLKSLICPHCGKQAGRVKERGFFPQRMFLSCIHCGSEIATDCVTWCNGGKPEKLDPTH